MSTGITRRSWWLLCHAAGIASASKASNLPPKISAFGHRNLFNGDSCTYFYNPELWQPEGGPYSARAIHRYVDLLADSGIDTFLINPNAQVAWYPSKKLQTILDGYHRGDREFFRGHAIAVGTPPDQMDAYLDRQVKFFNLYQDLMDAGIDWLAETSKACRRRGMSPWVSVRMNDMHGAANSAGSHFNCALFKQEKYRLEGRPLDPKDGRQMGWAGLNYERPEVRAFMMSHVREYLDDYDFEGMELDWLRNPLCCNPPAGQAQCDLVVAWIREVRKQTEARAKKLGKPVPLGLRIPGNLGYMKSIGVDVPRLVHEGLIDFIGFSNFWQTTWDMPYDELRRQVGPDVLIYGVVEDAPNWVHGHAPALQAKSHPNLGIRYMAASRQMQWANAAGKLAMGVDGIEQFNFFCTDQVQLPGLRCDYAALRDTQNLDKLRGKPKHYCLESPSGRSSAAWELPEPVPVGIDAKGRREFRLSMCSEPKDHTLTVQVAIPKREGDPEIGVSVNGCWPRFEKRRTSALLFPVGPYTEHLPENQAYNFAFSAAEILEGWNRILVINNEKESAVRIVSLELGIRDK
jgi:hypothetical protein